MEMLQKKNDKIVKKEKGKSKKRDSVLLPRTQKVPASSFTFRNGSVKQKNRRNLSTSILI